jgi:thiamine pyrophosphate-dependent acetolactate synthase large subunit-like protein
MPAHVPSDQLSPEVLAAARRRAHQSPSSRVGAQRLPGDAHHDTGRRRYRDALFAAVDIRANEIVGPGYYATMGFAVPAALGADRQRPPSTRSSGTAHSR